MTSITNTATRAALVVAGGGVVVWMLIEWLA